MKIGVSGDIASFSEEAAMQYCSSKKIESELVYATDMEGVLSRLNKDEFELGIFPIFNVAGGIVIPAFEAMGKYTFQFIDNFRFLVNQCLMVKKGVQTSYIKRVVSHPQSLAQCKKYLTENFPDVEKVEWIDNGKAAADLSKGKLSDDSAVIASRRSAEIYNLELLEQGIQDVKDNYTYFIIVKK